jgi:hypothetical protein
MIEMTERVARAIEVAQEHRRRFGSRGQLEAVALARAAIAEMREPTDAMVQVVLGDEMSEAEAKWLWGMMLDAALK